MFANLQKLCLKDIYRSTKEKKTDNTLTRLVLLHWRELKVTHSAQKPTAIYCLVLFSIGDYKLWSLIIRQPLKISF